MSLPDDQELMQKIVIMSFVLDQKEWLIMALLARCGGDAKITKEELDFVRRTYTMDESISSASQVLTDVHMKLKMK
jgi:hypothetical protein